MASSTPTAASSDTQTTMPAARRSSSSCPPSVLQRTRFPPRMTERLYYADAYCRGFSAAITRVGRREGRVIVELDRTAFYPTSGGQPFDTGTLVARTEGRESGTESPALHVVDVLDEDSGAVVHVLTGDEPAVG